MFESCSSLNFFRLSFRSGLSCVDNCEGLSFVNKLFVPFLPFGDFRTVLRKAFGQEAVRENEEEFVDPLPEKLRATVVSLLR